MILPRTLCCEAQRVRHPKGTATAKAPFANCAKDGPTLKTCTQTVYLTRKLLLLLLNEFDVEGAGQVLAVHAGFFGVPETRPMNGGGCGSATALIAPGFFDGFAGTV